MANLLENLTTDIGKLYTGVTGQDYIRSTQYQKTVEDMKAAGLNPAAMYGSGMQQSFVPSNHGSLVGTIITEANNLINSAANITRANTERLNAKTSAEKLSLKERELIQKQSQRIYDESGKLIAKVINKLK